MKTVRFISRILIGIVFIFSGFVKGIDPFGSAYKFIDYFNAFHIGFLEPMALPLAIILSTAELLIGIGLFLGLRMKVTSWALLLFMSFFTVLTLFIAITNPVTDCGCFGDAVVLTNWQTFFKNIFFMGLTLIVFLNRNDYPDLLKSKFEWIFIGLFVLSSVLLSIYCIEHLPIIDFRPYSIGTYIPNKMEIPDGAPIDEYEINVIYKKDGIEKRFNLENLPDSSWEFVVTETKLIKQGYVPPIHDFTIDDIETGDDYTNEILEDDNFTFLIINYDLNKSDFKNQNKLNELAAFCEENNFNIIGLTSSVKEEIDQYTEQYNILYKYYSTDEITLKTIVRANPGVVLLKEGTIINKWHSNDLPKIVEFNKNLIVNSIASLTSKNKAKIIWIYIIGFLFLVSFFNNFKTKYIKWFK